MSMDVLFVGGTGQISLRCVERAAGEGHRVTVFNRGQREEKLPEGVTSIAGDMSDPASYGQLGEQSWDVVCQFMVFTPDQMVLDIETFAGKAGQYIFISSASVYEKPARHYVITEKTPTVNPFWVYSQNKIACEAALRASDDLSWTIVRPSHTIRTGLPAQVGDGAELGHRLMAGKPVLVAGDGTSVWTLTRPADFAVPFVGLFGKDAALGEDFHITQDRGFTWDQIYQAIARGLGVEAKIVHVPTDTLVRYEPEWTGPLMGDKSWTALFDNSKVKAVAGAFTCVEGIDEVVAESVANFKAQREQGGPGADADDALMDRIAAEQMALG